MIKIESQSSRFIITNLIALVESISSFNAEVGHWSPGSHFLKTGMLTKVSFTHCNGITVISL